MIPDRYNFRNVKRGLRYPNIIQREVQSLLTYPLLVAHQYLVDIEPKNGINVMKEDWDNLILLDACRYDYFTEQNFIEGELRRVLSKGGHSWEFMQNNFVDREFHDTIYITANPHADKLADGTFYYMENLLSTSWDNELGTVHPSDVVEKTIDISGKFPNKRLIVHFMQPHRPYLGPTADQVRERFDIKGYNTRGRHDRKGIGWFQGISEGRISWEETRQAYRETLDIVLEHAGGLLEKIDGKSVITSDHGELLGEKLVPFDRSRSGHPRLKTKETYFVPWLETPSENVRKISTEEPIESDNVDEEVIEDRLAALGYKAK